MAGIGLEYKGLASISGPIIVVENVKNVGYDELVSVKTQNGETRLGKVIQVSQKAVMVQVFEGTTGLSLSQTRTRFLGHSLEVPVSTEMLGRVMNSFGEPIDGHPRFFTDEKRDVNGYPLNPTAREYPRDFIQTGISAIDGLTSLVRGQKLPVFQRSRFITQRTRRPNRPASTDSQRQRTLQHRLHRHGPRTRRRSLLQEELRRNRRNQKRRHVPQPRRRPPS